MAPSLLLAAPIMSVLAALGVTSAAIGLLSCGATGVLAVVMSEQIADMGRQLQETLFAKWGGSPTTRALCLTNSANLTIARHRRDAVEHLTGRPLPSGDDEVSDFAAALEQIELALDQVRAMLREDDSNRILADVNASYGFRRNSLAVRWIGRGTSLIGTAAALVLWRAGATRSPTSFLIAALIDVLLAAFWWGMVNEGWVRRDAERYATQFFITLLKAASTA